jgi:hypothetical protein
MPFYKKDNKFFDILPKNSDKFLSMGEDGNETFYIKNNGETPFGSPAGYTFTSLVDTPTELDKNLNQVLGSLGDKIGWITDTAFNTLKIENKLHVKDVEVNGLMSIKGVVRADTKIISKQFIADDIIKTKHLQVENADLQEVKIDNLTADRVQINDLAGNIINCDEMKAKVIHIAGDVAGSINEPIMISRAETHQFDMVLNVLDIYASYPFNKSRVEFTVKTECLLQDKIVDCIVNQVYGEDDILWTSKMIYITEPNEFKVVLNLGNHTGNTVLKIRLSVQ